MPVDYSYTPKKERKGLTDADHKKIDDIIKDFENDVRKLDESNPHEQAMIFNLIKQNPPEPDFMKVTVDEVTDEDGNKEIVSESVDNKGEKKRLFIDRIMVFSPFIGFTSNIAKAASHVVPMLIDEACNVVAEEKKAFKPEKRKDEYNWSWVWILLCIAGAAAAGAFLLFRGMGVV